MASWTHDCRPMALTEWGLYHNEVRPAPVVPETKPDVRPSCINKTGDDVGEE
jgi:hypothetical protein